MKVLKYITFLLSVSVLLVSCSGEKDSRKLQSNEVQNEETEVIETDSNINAIKEKLCNQFPKDLVLGYNPDANRIEIETIDNGSGGILHCNIKLFYGEKEYEFWAGQVAAWVNKMEDPFWQYNPDKNSTLYNKIEGLGDKAVYITNMYQLQILKDGVLYMITPPNNGIRTSTGKDTKEIALEVAKHYNI